jgi:hypothetical protein
MRTPASGPEDDDFAASGSIDRVSYDSTPT